MAFIQKEADRTFDKVGVDYAVGVSMDWSVSKEKGAPRFAMRVINIESGGKVGLHDHEWEHEIYVAKGKGEMWIGDKVFGEFAEGDVLFVPPGGVKHAFINTGDGLLKIICVVPYL